MKNSSFAALLCAGVFVLLSTFVASVASAQSFTKAGFQSINGYTLYTPDGWKTFSSEVKTFRGGSAEQVFVSQDTDIYSRTTKYFMVVSGVPEAVFGLSKKVVDRVSHEQLVDFFIDQQNNSHIDYRVTKTSVKGTGDTKTYVIEANYSVAGYRQFEITHITFKGKNAYLRSLVYLAPFAQYLPTMQTVLDTMTIQ